MPPETALSAPTTAPRNVVCFYCRKRVDGVHNPYDCRVKIELAQAAPDIGYAWDTPATTEEDDNA